MGTIWRIKDGFEISSFSKVQLRRVQPWWFALCTPVTSTASVRQDFTLRAVVDLPRTDEIGSLQLTADQYFDS